MKLVACCVLSGRGAASSNCLGLYFSQGCIAVDADHDEPGRVELGIHARECTPPLSKVRSLGVRCMRAYEVCPYVFSSDGQDNVGCCCINRLEVVFLEEVRLAIDKGVWDIFCDNDLSTKLSALPGGELKTK